MNKLISFQKLIDTLTEKEISFFFKQRPFLLDSSKEQKIISLTDDEIEEKVQNLYALDEAITIYNVLLTKIDY